MNKNKSKFTNIGLLNLQYLKTQKETLQTEQEENSYTHKFY